MSEEPKLGEHAAGYWHEWEWCPEYSMTIGGYWEATYSLRIYPSKDGRYSVSAGGAWLPERPDTFRAAEDAVVGIDTELFQTAAENAALREEVRRLRGLVEAAYREGVADGPASWGADWEGSDAYAALAERPEGTPE